MSDIQKQIEIFTKQNEGIESSLEKKGVEFTKIYIADDEPEKKLASIRAYNNYLKAISSSVRPPQVKEQKQKVEEQPKKKDEEDEDDIPKEVKPVFSTVTNMEDIKRAFFSKEYETFQQLVRQQPFKYYKACYKYAEDNTGRPSFVAKNLLRGFVQNLDDYRKYLMVGFRCICHQDSDNILHYRYPSYWIVNSNDDLHTIIGSFYDDFEFTLVEEPERILRMLRRMEKNEDDNDNELIGEVYVH